MTKHKAQFGLTPREHRVSVLPATVGSIIVLAIVVFDASVLAPESPLQTILLIAAGVLGIIYLAAFDLLIVPWTESAPVYSWINAILAPLGLLVITYSIPESMDLYVGALLILAVLTSSVVAGRGPAYAMIGLTVTGILIVRIELMTSVLHWTLHVEHRNHGLCGRGDGHAAQTARRSS